MTVQEYTVEINGNRYSEGRMCGTVEKVVNYLLGILRTRGVKVGLSVIEIWIGGSLVYDQKGFKPSVARKLQGRPLRLQEIWRD